jgi:hypothetical protein
MLLLGIGRVGLTSLRRKAGSARAHRASISWLATAAKQPQCLPGTGPVPSWRVDGFRFSDA